MIKDHEALEKHLTNELESIELYFTETRKTVVSALSAIGDYYDKATESLEPGEARSDAVRDLRELSQELSLTLAVALRNVQFGLDTWRHLHNRIGLPCGRRDA